MPQTTLLVYRKSSGVVELTAWLDDLERTEPKAYEACLNRILELERMGHEMRPPANRHLGEGIYELRAKRGRVHYRVLYFFCGQNIVCMTHGFTKEGEVPPIEIDRAKNCSELVKGNRDRYTEEWEL